MTLELLKRADKGSVSNPAFALTAAEHDTNLTAIELAVNALTRDGITIYEASPVEDPLREFLSGGTFVLTPPERRHRIIKVGDAARPLTANMILDLNVANDAWTIGASVTVQKRDVSAFTVTVRGFNEVGTDTEVLANRNDSLTAAFVSSTNGIGPDNNKFVLAWRASDGVGGPQGIEDGDYGDVVVSGGGQTMTINPEALSPATAAVATRTAADPSILLGGSDREISDASGVIRANTTIISPTEATEVRVSDQQPTGARFRLIVGDAFPVELHRTSHELRLPPTATAITTSGTAASGFDTTLLSTGQAIEIFREGDVSSEGDISYEPLTASGTTISAIVSGTNGSVTLSQAAAEDSMAGVLAVVQVGERGTINGQTEEVRLWPGSHLIEVTEAAPFLHLSVTGPGPDLQPTEALTDDFTLTSARWGSTLLFTAAVAKTVTVPAGVSGAWAVIDNRGTADLAFNGTAASVVIDTEQGDGSTYDATIPAGGKAVITYYAALDAKLDGRLKESV